MSLEPPRKDGPVKMWVGGVVVPLAPILYGIRGLVVGKTILPSRSGEGLELTGTDAVLLSCACICLGLLIHAHYFWRLHSKLWRFSDALKGVSVVGFLCFFGIVIFRMARTL